jgi:hypothetical protein
MTKQRKLSESLKKIIAHREEYKCAHCKVLLPPSFQIDHIIPYSISNNDDNNNLQALCPNCHSLKSQRENLRIYKYKKLFDICPSNTKLCWFCLETVDSFKEHNKTCDKKLKKFENIQKKQHKTFQNIEQMLGKYKYVEKDLIHTFNKLNIKTEQPNKNLKITINFDDIIIILNNSFFYKLQKKVEDVVPSDIADAITYYTRYNKLECTFDTLEFNFIFKEEQNSEDYAKNCSDCLEYISEILLDFIPSDVIKNKEEIFFVLLD